MLRIGSIIGLVLVSTLLLSACAGRPPAPAKGAVAEPRVLEITDTVVRNQFGLVTVQSEPRLDCAFSTEVKLTTGKVEKSAGETSTGADGKAYWSWLVHPAAVPGTYDLKVECGGKAASTRYTVR